MQPDYARQLCASLKTSRLNVRPLVGSDAEAAFAPLQNDAVYQWISMDKPDDMDRLCARWARLETRLSPDGTEAWPTWAITTSEHGTMIGRVDAVIDNAQMCTNFGYYLFPHFWGHGFATEAVKATADHLLQQGLRRLVATVTVGNLSSGRVLQKAGFCLNRILPGNGTLRGNLVDDEEYVRMV